MNETRAGGGADRVDWVAAERSPEFQELRKRKRAFILPATIFFLAWFFGFILLTAYAEDFMAESVYEGLTVGYCLALTQFLMVLVLGVLYLRRSANVFDPLAARAIEGYSPDDGRFARTGAGDTGDGGVGSRAATSETEGAR